MWTRDHNGNLLNLDRVTRVFAASTTVYAATSDRIGGEHVKLVETDTPAAARWVDRLAAELGGVDQFVNLPTEVTS